MIPFSKVSDSALQISCGFVVMINAALDRSKPSTQKCKMDGALDGRGRKKEAETMNAFLSYNHYLVVL